ncbi:bifunctional DedA family/phosphatase PAP2 family protein [Frigidibacter sp. SD6-1]|uniref:bifunctional DedA family/phosphatase PAP2 family protein n=1 Tax=Frigidibacter sp. SD6-1 TaxID=3032581 RepID=UPI0024DF7A4A|nr:bifunctional DedA family/phosphatase PAP2 family protein [Frigidibacter sp. SD6-1]
MNLSLDQILPSLQALGVLSYWLIGLGSMLEAFFITGVVVPGTLIVDAGGILVQRGLLDFFDLAWFVALGSVLGSELSYWTGKLAMNRLPGRRRIGESAAFARAKGLFERRGGMALVIGRFLGPVAGLVPLVAGMADMDRRKFLIWNILGSIPYALAHVAIGFFLGDVMGRIGGSLTRVAVLTGIVLLALLILWTTLYSTLRLLPLAWAVMSAALRNLADLPAVRRRIADHPETARWVEARLDRNAFSGLTLSLLTVVFIYIGAIWLDSVFEFLVGDPLLGLDTRLSELIHHFQSPGPIQVASFITAVGGWQVVLPVMVAALIWLMTEGRRALAVGLAVSVAGNTITVAVLKLTFGRPRSPLGVFAETSGSFPSGHAAASVAAYGMLMYVVWRAGRFRAEMALLLAGLMAFAIGVSRIYLIEHYLSDVLNGWLVGALWVTVGIAISEWRLSRTSVETAPMARRARIAALAVAAGLAVLAASNVWRYDHPRNVPVQVADQVLSDAAALAQMGLPAQSESLMGSPVHPVSLVVFARDEFALSDAVLASNWTAAQLPTPGLVFDAIFAAVGGSEDPTVETVSHFWRGQPNDLAFVQRPPGATPSLADPKLRFWRTEFVTADGLRAFVGTVGVDEAGETETTQTIGASPMLRDTLVQGLVARGATVLAASHTSDNVVSILRP